MTCINEFVSYCFYAIHQPNKGTGSLFPKVMAAADRSGFGFVMKPTFRRRLKPVFGFVRCTASERGQSLRQPELRIPGLGSP